MTEKTTIIGSTRISDEIKLKFLTRWSMRFALLAGGISLFRNIYLSDNIDDMDILYYICDICIWMMLAVVIFIGLCIFVEMLKGIRQLYKWSTSK